MQTATYPDKHQRESTLALEQRGIYTGMVTYPGRHRRVPKEGYSLEQDAETATDSTSTGEKIGFSQKGFS